MNRLTRGFTKTLSVRISLMVVFWVAILLLAALLIMFLYSRKVMREEALQKAEQTLESTALQIDNVLLSVEQASGNIYWDLLEHLHEPDRMWTYCRKIVETNPFVMGCAVAFEPYYYKEKGQYFLCYVRRKQDDQLETDSSHIIQAATYGNIPYPEQVWYAMPIQKGYPFWVSPQKGEAEGSEKIITFSLPIFQGYKRVGVMGVDVSLPMLSHIVASAKPSPNSYAVMLDSVGSYIVHPDSNIFSSENLSSLSRKGMHPSMVEAGKSMIAGEANYKALRQNGSNYYVFYKPFRRSEVPGRSNEHLKWSIGIVYPEADIFGNYGQLATVVVLISIVGLILLFVLCRTFTHRQLMPLRQLTTSARRIAEGNYNAVICDCRQHDEVGRLQDNFRQMQQALASNVGELQQLTDTLREQEKVLREAYEQAKEGDRMKTAFLHNVSDQLSAPVAALAADVKALNSQEQPLIKEEMEQLVADVQQQGNSVANLLNYLLQTSQAQGVEDTNEKKTP
ncbi:MAG: HAMP domain-containing protein [Prevotella sp.]|nr:HAMP domain-containing protein [Prevotella sp.]